jgi:outer membrane protein TolC
MKASGKQVRRWGRQIGWKTAGVTVLGLLGGSTGCSLLHDEPLPRIATAQGPAALPPMVRFSSGTPNPTAPSLSAPLPQGERGEKAPVGGAEEQQAEPEGTYRTQERLAAPAGGLNTPAIPPPSAVRPIRLVDVLALAGVDNPTILLAEQAVQSSLALQMQARVLLLPNLNAGGDYDHHTGPIQNSFGLIVSPIRNNADVGLGTRAVVADTVAIPGVWLFAPLGDAVFQPIVAKRVVAQRSFEAVATRNDVLLDVAVGYLQLLGAEGRLAVVRQTERDFDEITRLTRAYTEVRQGRDSDYQRARTAADMVGADERRAQEEVATASAHLSRLLNLDPSLRLQIVNDPIEVVQLNDPQKTLPELIRIARDNRPELRAAAAEIAAARAQVVQEKARPLLPTLSVAYSQTGFGGGSNLSPPAFNGLHPRGDFDAMAFWTLQNFGLGNLARIRQRQAKVGEAEGRRGVWVNRIDKEVADAYNLSQARFREVQVARRQVESGVKGFQRDLTGIRGFTVLPIELLDSTNLLYQARLDLLRAIVAFDEAQFQLFVALGQPPTLAVAGDGGEH